MSLLGVKWSGTSAILSRSNTDSTPIFRTASMAIGAVTSLPRARSTRARISSPGSTRGFPAWLASIFSVSVMLIRWLPAFRHPAPPAPDHPHQLADRSRDDVERREQEDHHLGLGDQEEGEEDEDDQRVERPPAERFQVLEAVVLDGAHHQERQDVDGQEQRQVFEAARPAEVVEEQENRRDKRRGGRDRQAVELALFDGVDLDVEPRQPQRAADQEEERRQPAPPSELRERPAVNQERRRDSERHEVRQRVVLDAELRGGPGHARHPAVQPVEHGGRDDPYRGVLELPVVSRRDRIEAGEQGSRGDQVGKDVDPAGDPVFFPAFPSSHGSTPRMLSPARTRSPLRTRSTADAGRRTSTRDPKRIIPTRCPRRTVSPSDRLQTMRRATRPAI